MNGSAIYAVVTTRATFRFFRIDESCPEGFLPAGKPCKAAKTILQWAAGRTSLLFFAAPDYDRPELGDATSKRT